MYIYLCSSQVAKQRNVQNVMARKTVKDQCYTLKRLIHTSSYRSGRCQPRTFALFFFFFLVSLEKDRQLSTRCSLVSAWYAFGECLCAEENILAFPNLILLCFPLFTGYLFILLPCFQTFIRQIHLYCPICMLVNFR